MIYKIKKGSHRSTFWPKLTLKDTLVGTFKFIEGYDYSIEKQEDSNKLIGLSDNWHHHMDSIRIGWRVDPKTPKGVELVSIVYNNGVRKITSLTHVSVKKDYPFKIQIFDDEYVIKVNGMAIMLDRTSEWSGIRYQLSPYFGGTTKSPKDVLIDITLKDS